LVGALILENSNQHITCLSAIMRDYLQVLYGLSKFCQSLDKNISADDGMGAECVFSPFARQAEAARCVVPRFHPSNNQLHSQL